MHLKLNPIKLLKSTGVYSWQGLIAYLVGSIIFAYGGLYYISKTLLNRTIQFLNIHTPLWLIIILVFVALIIYLKIKKAHSSQDLDLLASIIEKNSMQDNTIDTLEKRIEAIEKHLELDGISQHNKLIKKLNTPDT